LKNYLTAVTVLEKNGTGNIWKEAIRPVQTKHSLSRRNMQQSYFTDFLRYMLLKQTNAITLHRHLKHRVNLQYTV